MLVRATRIVIVLQSAGILPDYNLIRGSNMKKIWLIAMLAAFIPLQACSRNVQRAHYEVISDTAANRLKSLNSFPSGATTVITLSHSLPP